MTQMKRCQVSRSVTHEPGRTRRVEPCTKLTLSRNKLALEPMGTPSTVPTPSAFSSDPVMPPVEDSTMPCKYLRSFTPEMALEHGLILLALCDAQHWRQRAIPHRPLLVLQLRQSKWKTTRMKCRHWKQANKGMHSRLVPQRMLKWKRCSRLQTRTLCRSLYLRCSLYSMPHSPPPL